MYILRHLLHTTEVLLEGQVADACGKHLETVGSVGNTCRLSMGQKVSGSSSWLILVGSLNEER